MKNINIKMLVFAVAAAALAGGCKNKELEAFNNLEKDRFLVKPKRSRSGTWKNIYC